MEGDGVERLHSDATRLRGVVGRSATSVDDVSAFREPRLRRHAPQPIGLREDRLPRLLAGHRSVYSTNHLLR